MARVPPERAYWRAESATRGIDPKQQGAVCYSAHRAKSAVRSPVSGVRRRVTAKQRVVCFEECVAGNTTVESGQHRSARGLTHSTVAFVVHQCPPQPVSERAHVSDSNQVAIVPVIDDSI